MHVSAYNAASGGSKHRSHSTTQECVLIAIKHDFSATDMFVGHALIAKAGLALPPD